MGRDTMFPDQRLGITHMIKKNKSILINNVEQFKLENKIQVNCISDQTLLYIRYILATSEKRKKKEFDPVFIELVNEVYKETRGSNFDIGISTPSTLAAAIIMIASESYKKHTKTKPMIQKDIYDIFLTHTSASITHAIKKLVKFFNEKNITFDLSGDNNAIMP